MENLETFKLIFPYLIQMAVGIGVALMVFKIRLVRIESRFDFLQREMTNRLDKQEKATEKLEAETKNDFKKLDEKLDNLINLFGKLDKSVSSIDGYLQGRKEKAAEIALKRAKKKT